MSGTYDFPFHFIVKVKVIKGKEEVCRKCFHVILFVTISDANVMLFLKKQEYDENFLQNL